MRKIITGLFAVTLLFLAGCASEPENMSERPWNAPKNWEHGLPTGMMNQR